MALITYTLVNVTWVFFRAKSFPAAAGMLAAMFGMHAHTTAIVPTVHILETVFCTSGLLSVQWYMRERSIEEVVTRAPWGLVAGAWATMALAVILAQGTGDAFTILRPLRLRVALAEDPRLGGSSGRSRRSPGSVRSRSSHAPP